MFAVCIIFAIIIFPPYHFAFYSTSYSSSNTDLHHSFVQSSPGTSTAICENQLFFFAPCQCLTLAGIFITLPSHRLTASFPFLNHIISYAMLTINLKPYFRSIYFQISFGGMPCTHLPKTIPYDHKQNTHKQILRKRPHYRLRKVSKYKLCL